MHSESIILQNGRLFNKQTIPMSRYISTIPRVFVDPVMSKLGDIWRRTVAKYDCTVTSEKPSSRRATTPKKRDSIQGRFDGHINFIGKCLKV